MDRNIGKNIFKNLSSKYCQKILDHAKQYATDGLKTASKKVIQKTAEAVGDLIGNEIADRMTKVSKTSPQNSSVTNEESIEHGKEIYRERYTYIQKRDNYRRFKINIIIKNDNGISKNNKLVRKYAK